MKRAHATETSECGHTDTYVTAQFGSRGRTRLWAGAGGGSDGMRGSAVQIDARVLSMVVTPFAAPALWPDGSRVTYTACYTACPRQRRLLSATKPVQPECLMCYDSGNLLAALVTALRELRRAQRARSSSPPARPPVPMRATRSASRGTGSRAYETCRGGASQTCLGKRRLAGWAAALAAAIWRGGRSAPSE